MKAGQSHKINFSPIFIGGSPRSGTTLLNSLICSSDKVNRHMQECSYFYWSIKPLKLALGNFEKSQGHYFACVDDLIQFHSETLKQILIAIWEQENRPDFLCLKNPNMVKDFYLLARALPSAKFVVIIRDPLDIIASRAEAERRGNPKFQVNSDFIKCEIDNINEIHESVFRYFDECKSKRINVVEYERLVGGFCLENLKSFLNLPDIQRDGLWSRTKDNMHSKDSQWITPLYGGPMKDSSVGKYSQTLSTDVIDYVKSGTDQLYEQVKAHARQY
jgi:hypothetical protein